jgi:hypothetical protein
MLLAAAMLSFYQSSVNWWSRKVEENFTYKANYHYYFHFSGLEFIELPERDSLPSQKQDG